MESLSALVVRAQSGDKQAEQALYEWLRPYIRTLARSRDVLPAHQNGALDGSELTQAALLRVVKSLPDYRGSSDAEFKAWIRRIVHRQAIDLLRKQPPAGPDPDGPPPTELADDGSTPSGRLLRDERGLRLMQALERLPEDERQAVRLRHLQQASIPEIARQLGNRTDQATASLIYRGMNRLRRLLREPD